VLATWVERERKVGIESFVSVERSSKGERAMPGGRLSLPGWKRR
jgi:hypothetical protein